MHRYGLRLSKSAAVQKSNAKKDLDISVNLMINVVQQCHDGKKKRKKRSTTERSTERSTVSELHKASISICTAQHSDEVLNPVWHFREDGYQLERFQSKMTNRI